MRLILSSVPSSGLASFSAWLIRTRRNPSRSISVEAHGDHRGGLGSLTTTARGLLVTWKVAPALEPLSGMSSAARGPSTLTSGRFRRQASRARSLSDCFSPLVGGRGRRGGAGAGGSRSSLAAGLRGAAAPLARRRQPRRGPPCAGRPQLAGGRRRASGARRQRRWPRDHRWRADRRVGGRWPGAEAGWNEGRRGTGAAGGGAGAWRGNQPLSDEEDGRGGQRRDEEAARPSARQPADRAWHPIARAARRRRVR